MSTYQLRPCKTWNTLWRRIFRKLVLNTDFSSSHELITDTVNILMFLCVLRKWRKSSLFEKGIEKQSWVFQVKGHFGFSSPILKNGESLVTVSATISPLDSETLKHLKSYWMEQMFSMLSTWTTNRGLINDFSLKTSVIFTTDGEG